MLQLNWNERLEIDNGRFERLRVHFYTLPELNMTDEALLDVDEDVEGLPDIP